MEFFPGGTVLLKGTYAYLRGVRLFFWPDFFQGVRLFKGVRLFQTLEYVRPSVTLQRYILLIAQEAKMLLMRIDTYASVVY